MEDDMKGLTLVVFIWAAVPIFAPEYSGQKWGELVAKFSVGYERGWASVMEASDE